MASSLMSAASAHSLTDGVGAMDGAGARGGMGNMSTIVDACTKMMESRALPPNQPQQPPQAPKKE
jgi:hypothetical protein